MKRFVVLALLVCGCPRTSVATDAAKTEARIDASSSAIAEPPKPPIVLPRSKHDPRPGMASPRFLSATLRFDADATRAIGPIGDGGAEAAVVVTNGADLAKFEEDVLAVPSNRVPKCTPDVLDSGKCPPEADQLEVTIEAPASMPLAELRRFVGRRGVGFMSVAYVVEGSEPQRRSARAFTLMQGSGNVHLHASDTIQALVDALVKRIGGRDHYPAVLWIDD